MLWSFYLQAEQKAKSRRDKEQAELEQEKVIKVAVMNEMAVLMLI